MTFLANVAISYYIDGAADQNRTDECLVHSQMC